MILNIKQALSWSYHHQSNEQVEVCIKFVKCTMEKCFDTNADINLALWQIKAMSATLLYNLPITCLIPKVNIVPINYNCKKMITIH